MQDMKGRPNLDVGVCQHQHFLGFIKPPPTWSEPVLSDEMVVTFLYWCCWLCVWQAETCHCKTCVSRAFSGLTGGFESHLLGIISVCFTVAVTHAVARCEVGIWGKNVWGTVVGYKQDCVCAAITFRLSFTSVSHLYASFVGVQCVVFVVFVCVCVCISDKWVGAMLRCIL